MRTAARQARSRDGPCPRGRGTGRYGRCSLPGPGTASATETRSPAGDITRISRASQHRLDATSHRVCDIKVHRTGPRCTNVHRFQAAADFYPFFYPRRRSGEVRFLYFLVTVPIGSARPGSASSLPSWSCGFDSRRPLRELLVHRAFSLSRSTDCRLLDSSGLQWRLFRCFRPSPRMCSRRYWCQRDAVSIIRRARRSWCATTRRTGRHAGSSSTGLWSSSYGDTWRSTASARRR
jgi:hypothetical protein